jgi:hypothetical protein
MKPPSLGRLRAEIAALGDARVSILSDGDALIF